MKKLLIDEYELYLDSFNDAHTHSLRINTSKISLKDFLKINPFNLKKIPWTDDGFYYDKNDNVSKHPYYYAGLYYIQEASAMLPAQILPIDENDVVLDGCSAPGGKSLKLANKLNGTGLLISNDISVSRSQITLKTLETSGIKNSYVIAQDINDLDNLNNSFDKILIDAPCSGEAMFRKDPSLIKSWLDKGPDYYQAIQKEIIKKAISLLKPGGMMVYSTCSFSIKENEEVIEYALSLDDKLKLLPIKQYEGFSSGCSMNTRNCVRLYPHKIKGEGHFIALLQKGSKKDSNIIKDDIIDKPDDDFFNNIDMTFKNGQFITRENKLYFEPDNNLNLKGLRILRSGLLLGEYRNDKFEPSHSLACSLKYNEYKNVLNFSLDDIRVLKYLKCETLDVKDKYVDGLVLVCVDKYPLGFGYVSKGILKNRFPSNYRYK